MIGQLPELNWREWWAWVLRTARTEADKVQAFVQAATRFSAELGTVEVTRRNLEEAQRRVEALDESFRAVLGPAVGGLREELDRLEENGVGLLARVREFLTAAGQAKAGGDQLGVVVAGWVLLGVGAGAVAGGAALTWWLTRNDALKAKASALGNVLSAVESGQITPSDAAAMLRAAGIAAGGWTGTAAVLGLGIIAVAMWPRVRRHAGRVLRAG